ncbi:MAG: 30S ribosome-binding factor RbfA [Bacteroidales bacterium]|nr:30S ribosome-binding factor RbfA [Candidatus Cryptobacteroides aphodequi]
MEGQSTRQLKVAREVQRHLAEIIRRRPMSQFGGAMLSVSEVRISPDLSQAKVFVSVFPSDKQQSAMKILAEQKSSIRGELGREVAQQLRIVPDLDFYLDTTLDYAEHIEELLKK